MYQLAKNTQILNGEILEKMKLSGYPILVIDWYREVELYKEEFLGDVQDHCGRLWEPNFFQARIFLRIVLLCWRSAHRMEVFWRGCMNLGHWTRQECFDMRQE